MKIQKIIVILSILVIFLLVVSCAPGQNSLAGNAKALPKGVTAPAKEVLKQQPGEGKPEICDNNVDDNGDKKVDCADPKCLNFITSDGKNHDAACVNGQRKICDGKSVPYGAVFNWKTADGGVDIVCYENGKYSSWGECSVSKGLTMHQGSNGVVKNLHDVVVAGGVNYICSYKQIAGKDFQSWVGCNGNLGPGGVKANVGEENSDVNGGFFCNGKSWSTEICDNGKDDNGDGKIDCLDLKCSGFAGTDANKRDYLCSATKGKVTCDNEFHKSAKFDGKSGYAYNIYSKGLSGESATYEFLCYNNQIIECNTNGKIKLFGKAGKTAKLGDVISPGNPGDIFGYPPTPEVLCASDLWQKCYTPGDIRTDGSISYNCVGPNHKWVLSSSSGK